MPRICSERFGKSAISSKRNFPLFRFNVHFSFVVRFKAATEPHQPGFTFPSRITNSIPRLNLKREITLSRICMTTMYFDHINLSTSWLSPIGLLVKVKETTVATFRHWKLTEIIERSWSVDWSFKRSCLFIQQTELAVCFDCFVSLFVCAWKDNREEREQTTITTGLYLAHYSK